MEENSLIVADGGILSDAIEYNDDENGKDKVSNEEDGSEGFWFYYFFIPCKLNKE